jgi:AcrR family transcriptional regulator
MANTPWGEASTLRTRMLRPGRGVPPAEVEQSQRERLFGATVAAVDEKGYEATSVADILALSGVSRTTFYEHFDDKHTCFVATVEAIVEMTMEIAARRYGRKEGSDARARALLDTYIDLIVAQPAASRICFVEAYAVGPEAQAAIRKAVDGFESLAGEAVAEIPDLRGMAPEMLSALVGALFLIVHARLHRREEASLPDLLPQLWEWVLNYRPPPQPLQQREPEAPAPMGDQRPSELSTDPSERIIRAVSAAVAEHGCAATTIAEIAKRAAISQTTFYKCFDGRQEALHATVDAAAARMVAAVVPAARQGADWPDSIRVAIATLCEFAAAQPDLTHLLAFGIYAAGPAALNRRDKLTQALEELFTTGYELSPNTSPIAAEAAVGVLYGLMYDQIDAEGPGSLAAVAPLATYVSLVHFVGEQQACVVVNGWSSANWPASQ